jgi:hypothetical protein
LLLFQGQNLGAGAASSSYESSSYESSSAGLGGGGYNASLAVGGGGGGLAGGASSYESAFESSSSSTQVQQYATDAQGLYIDQNPQIIRRAAAGGVQTYTQHIQVRFLQPPPVPPPGVRDFYHFS